MTFEFHFGAILRLGRHLAILGCAPELPGEKQNQVEQVEVHCDDLEADKTGVLCAQNARSLIMHVANHAFCVNRIAEK